MKLSIFYRFALFLLLSISISSSLPAESTGRAASWQEKIDERVLRGALLSQNGEIEFLVYMREQADLSDSHLFNNKEEKGDFVFSRLTETAQTTQASLLMELAGWEVDHHPYWVANLVWVRGNMDILEGIAGREDVARIFANSPVPILEPEIGFTPLYDFPTAGIEWNISRLGTPAVWEYGFTGQGVVIGGQDTGYEWRHPALTDKYRGWNGTEANHDYNWHDAIREPLHDDLPDNPCGYASLEPCDDYGHGTHTMGTIVGDDTLGNQIGMAPGAKWIGCRNMDRGLGKPSTYLECFEWFVAPYSTGGDSFSGDPVMAPHIINNSWGCPPSEGCYDPEVLETVVNNVRAAGILIVSSAGNSGGNGCETISTPTAIYESVFTVGATDGGDGLAAFSSRGPVIVDGSSRLKPNVSAPGISIRSSFLNGTYGYSNGTSMASPHVAGLAALIISARPDLAGKVDELEDIIQKSAFPKIFPGECGGFPGSEIPNPFYGWGRVDAFSALAAALDWPSYYFPLMLKNRTPIE